MTPTATSLVKSHVSLTVKSHVSLTCARARRESKMLVSCLVSCRSARRLGLRHLATAARPSPPVAVVQQLVRKHKPLCVAVVDAADFEGTVPSRAELRNILANKANSNVVLAINKADRMILDNHVIEFLRSRFANKTPHGCLEVQAVSSRTGAGIAELAQLALDGSRDVLIFGSTGTGKTQRGIFRQHHPHCEPIALFASSS